MNRNLSVLLTMGIVIFAALNANARSAFEERKELSRENTRAQIQAGYDRYYARINAKIIAGLEAKYQRAFYKDGKGFLASDGSVACGHGEFQNMLGPYMDCLSPRGQSLDGLSSRELRRILGTDDYKSYFGGK